MASSPNGSRKVQAVKNLGALIERAKREGVQSITEEVAGLSVWEARSMLLVLVGVVVTRKEEQ